MKITVLIVEKNVIPPQKMTSDTMHETYANCHDLCRKCDKSLRKGKDWNCVSNLVYIK